MSNINEQRITWHTQISNARIYTIWLHISWYCMHVKSIGTLKINLNDIRMRYMSPNIRCWTISKVASLVVVQVVRWMSVRKYWSHKSSKAIMTRHECHTTQRTNQRKTTNHNKQHTNKPNATQDDERQRTTHKATKRSTNQCNAQINARLKTTTTNTQSN